MAQDPVVMVRRAALGSRLRELRSKERLSQEELADLAGVDRSFYTQVELGTTSPRVDWLHLIAAALKVHISELFMEPAPDRGAPEQERF
jgi:transcriptional regulator with XRE-family HTH domain